MEEDIDNFQRKGSISNAHVGREFEELVKKHLNSKGYSLIENISVAIGISDRKKSHAFDLGSRPNKILVECKAHTWTSGGNVPSAKITTWDQAMYYFAISPPEFRKLFCMQRDLNPKTGESLAEYYTRLRYHLIPNDVEFWEFDLSSGDVDRVNITKE